MSRLVRHLQAAAQQWLSGVISASGPQLTVLCRWAFHWQAPLSEAAADGNHCLTWPSYRPQQHDPIKHPPARWCLYSLKEIFPLRRIVILCVYERKQLWILKKRIYLSKMNRGQRMNYAMAFWLSSFLKVLWEKKLGRNLPVLLYVINCWIITLGYLNIIDVGYQLRVALAKGVSGVLFPWLPPQTNSTCLLESFWRGENTRSDKLLSMLKRLIHCVYDKNTYNPP